MDKVSKQVSNQHGYGWGKYNCLIPLITKMLVEGGHTKSDISVKACKFLDERGISYGSKPPTDFENPVYRTISRATRPLDHPKNILGVNALYSEADGTFSCANYKAKYGVEFHTLESAAKANGGIDKYKILSERALQKNTNVKTKDNVRSIPKNKKKTVQEQADKEILIPEELEEADRYLNKYVLLRKYLSPLLKSSDNTLDELKSIGRELLEKNGHSISEFMLNREIRRSTRPVGHHKNEWGIRCATDLAGSGKFGVKYVESRFGGLVTMAEVEAAGQGSSYQATKPSRTEATKEKDKTKERTINDFDDELTIKKHLEERSDDWPAVQADKYTKGVKRQTRVQLQSKSVQDQLRKGGEDIVVKQEHNKLQNKIYEKLYNSKGETDTVEMEANYIDIKVENDKQVTLYEVKLGRPIRCIKEGLGQLLSYIYSFEDDTRKKKIVIAGKYAPDEEEKTFINFIKKTLQIDFEYRQCS